MNGDSYLKATWFLAILLAISLSANIMLQNNIDGVDMTANAVSSGKVSICIGAAPIVNTSDCNSTGVQDQAYSCQLSVDNTNSSNVTYISSFVMIDRSFNSSNASLFEIEGNGEISFTPDNWDVGNYTIKFNASADSLCGSGSDYELFNLSILNINDAPVFSGELDDLILAQDQTFYGFYLGDYFSDPDEDTLLYNVSGDNQVNVECGAFYDLSSPNPANNQVMFSSSECGFTETLTFTAIDPYNATADSNAMDVTVECDDSEDSQTPSGGDDGGGGGGGGSSSGSTDDQDTFIPTTPKYSHFEHEDCTENWNCSDWGLCAPNGTMSRTCEDLRNCGTEKYKPETVKNCTYEGTCDDGIKNCHHDGCEENIDCGGPCPACSVVEVPISGLGEGDRNIIVYIVGGVVILLALAGKYFHKEISAGVLAFLKMFSKKKEKAILLSREDKKLMLEKLSKFEKKIKKGKPDYLIDKYGEILKQYLTKATGNNLMAEFGEDELVGLLKKKDKKRVHPLYNKPVYKVIDENLRKIFILLYMEYAREESKEGNVSKVRVRLFVECLRSVILNTSERESGDIEKEKVEIKTGKKAGHVERIRVGITNAYIALGFGEIGVAEEKYREVMRAAEENVAEQEIIQDINILRFNIEYVRSWANSL